MLKRIDQAAPISPDIEVATSKPTDLDLVLAAARRQARVLVASALIALFIGLAYIVTAVPLYTATTDLFIDSQKNKGDASATIAELTFDTGAIDSQVEVLKSEKIALSVISTMHLTSDPEFMGARRTTHRAIPGRPEICVRRLQELVRFARQDDSREGVRA